MPIVAPKETLAAAHSSGYAIGAFNATNPSRETSRSATLYAVEKARRHGAKVVLDIDFRADQWPDVRYFGSAIRALVPLLDVVIGTELG